MYAVLKDRYENDVFNDSTTILNLEIPDLYKPVIRPGSLQKAVSQGKAQFELNGTEIPGVAYFKVGTTPSLAENSFELIGQAPFAKERLTIALMRDEEGLTERGKSYFTEYNSQTYISRFSTKYQLENSENYLALPESIRTALSNFWDETNALTVR